MVALIASCFLGLNDLDDLAGGGDEGDYDYIDICLDWPFSNLFKTTNFKRNMGCDICSFGRNHVSLLLFVKMAPKTKFFLNKICFFLICVEKECI